MAPLAAAVCGLLVNESREAHGPGSFVQSIGYVIPLTRSSSAAQRGFGNVKNKKRKSPSSPQHLADAGPVNKCLR